MKSVKASRSLSRASLLPLSHKYGTLISSTQTMWNLLAPPFSSLPPLPVILLCLNLSHSS